ncbi:MAG TPA: hypothetical protein VFN21_03045 [Acidimicrobiales bacterium]|nr:hypothetical protein [Acidimicrobiales bacterium]
MTWKRTLSVLAVLCAIVIGVHQLREATQSRHHATPPGSRTWVVVDAHQNRAPSSHTLEDMTDAQLRRCQIEVEAHQVRDLAAVPGESDHFVVVLQPALDASDRTQYQGCVEDWTFDHLLLQVHSMQDQPPVGDRR